MAMALDFAYFQIFPDVFMLSQQKRTVICHHCRGPSRPGRFSTLQVSPNSAALDQQRGSGSCDDGAKRGGGVSCSTKGG